MAVPEEYCTLLWHCFHMWGHLHLWLSPVEQMYLYIQENKHWIAINNIFWQIFSNTLKKKKPLKSSHSKTSKTERLITFSLLSHQFLRKNSYSNWKKILPVYMYLLIDCIHTNLNRNYREENINSNYMACIFTYVHIHRSQTWILTSK